MCIFNGVCASLTTRQPLQCIVLLLCTTPSWCLTGTTTFANSLLLSTLPMGTPLAHTHPIPTPHTSKQGYFAELQSKRLEYDAERRKLVARATAATSAAAAKAAAAQQQQQPQEHVVGGMSNAAVEDPAMAQLAEEAAAINSEPRCWAGGGGWSRCLQAGSWVSHVLDAE